MQCYECGEPAVAICRWCQVGLCRTHLAESLAARTGAHVDWCAHVMPSIARVEKRSKASAAISARG